MALNSDSSGSNEKRGGFPNNLNQDSGDKMVFNKPKIVISGESIQSDNPTRSIIQQLERFGSSHMRLNSQADR